MSQVLRPLRACLLLLAALGWPAVPAHAQQQVRVLSDQTMIWSRSFRSVEAAARAGTVPPTPSVRRASRQRPGPPAARRALARPATWYGFGTLGYGRFTASRSVDAVTGSSNGLWYGGGGRYHRRNGFFVEGAVERYQKTGERVFVFEDAVFPLGIENRVEITPLMGTAGYVFRVGGLRPYVGAGAGAYLYRETSDFADDAENIRETHPAYRGVAGVQWPIGTGFAAAIEVAYTTVPDALAGGAAAAFGETDLGGVQVRGRLLFGR